MINSDSATNVASDSRRLRIVIAGGTGQVGTMLSRAFHAEGHDVVSLSRSARNAEWRTIVWDARTIGPWTAEIDGADVVINLAGRSVNCRYNPRNRREILESRVQSTRIIGQAIARCEQPPPVWLQASTATIYAHRFDAANDEATGVLGGAEAHAPDTWRFSIDVARAWEDAARETVTPRTRQVLLRSAVTMSPDRGGIFDTLLRLVRLGLGGTNGSGRQYVSWIHDRDFIRAVKWLIENPTLQGPIILAAPNPLPNAEFMRGLRSAWGTRIGLPSSRWMLEVGALLIRTESELVLKSRRVYPRRLLESGFTFDFPDWGAAAADLCRRWRNSNGKPENASKP